MAAASPIGRSPTQLGSAVDPALGELHVTTLNDHGHAVDYPEEPGAEPRRGGAARGGAADGRQPALEPEQTMLTGSESAGRAASPATKEAQRWPVEQATRRLRWRSAVGGCRSATSTGSSSRAPARPRQRCWTTTRASRR